MGIWDRRTMACMHEQDKCNFWTVPYFLVHGSLHFGSNISDLTFDFVSCAKKGKKVSSQFSECQNKNRTTKVASVFLYLCHVKNYKLHNGLGLLWLAICLFTMVAKLATLLTTWLSRYQTNPMPHNIAQTSGRGARGSLFLFTLAWGRTRFALQGI